MSSTSRVNKRARLARRAENDAMRTARRDSLAVLLSRAQRGVPFSTDEAALLRAAVEAEIREGDAARTSERGQQRAMEQQRQRVEAAEAAIVEAEQRAERAEHQIGILHAIDEGRAHGARRIMDERNEWQQRAAQAEAALDRVRALATDMRTWCSPHGIATQYADDIERALNGQQDHAVTAPPVPEPYRAPAGDPVATLARIRDARQWADVQAQLGMYYGWTAEQSGQRARAYRLTAEQRAAQAEAELTRSENAREALRDRVAQAEELQRIAHETSNAAEQARAAAEARAQEAEEQATTQLGRARMWRQKAIETDDRADRFEAAWKSARQRAAAQRTLADSRQERLSIRARRIIELERRAERVEQRAEWAERHVSSTARALARGDRYRAAWHSARDRARQRAAEEQRVRGWLEHWADRARAAEDTLIRVYSLVERWRYTNDRKHTALPELRDALAGPDVITDRATIRNTLAEEPTR